MEWLYLLAAHPGALASFQSWLKDHEHACSEYALDGPIGDVPTLKGKRDAFREIQAYINNNLTLAQQSFSAPELLAQDSTVQTSAYSRFVKG